MGNLRRAESGPLMSGAVQLQCSSAHTYFQFNSPRQVLSSAVLSGGLVEAEGLLNMKVAAQSDASHCSPADSLAAYALSQGWQGRHVGMMTAASMNSLRVVEFNQQGVELAIAVTVGLHNARCAGDRAEHRILAQPVEEIGTINMVAITSARLTPAALTEAIITMTEAKATVLAELDVRSPVSGRIATGTGTDAIAVVNGHGPEEVAYCGKHVLFGEWLAKGVIETMASSLEYYFPQQNSASCVSEGGCHA